MDSKLNTQLHQSKDDRLGASLMQVDGLADHLTDQSMWSRFRDLEESIEHASEVLERFFDRNESDDDALSLLSIIWYKVHWPLSHDLELVGSLATREEFEEKVKQKSGKEFIDLVRDMVERKSLRDIMKNGLSFFHPKGVHHVLCLEVFFKPTSGDSEQRISAASKDGVQQSLNTLYNPFTHPYDSHRTCVGLHFRRRCSKSTSRNNLELSRQAEKCLYQTYGFNQFFRDRKVPYGGRSRKECGYGADVST